MDAGFGAHVCADRGDQGVVLMSAGAARLWRARPQRNDFRIVGYSRTTRLLEHVEGHLQFCVFCWRRPRRVLSC